MTADNPEQPLTVWNTFLGMVFFMKIQDMIGAIIK